MLTEGQQCKAIGQGFDFLSILIVVGILLFAFLSASWSASQVKKGESSEHMVCLSTSILPSSVSRGTTVFTMRLWTIFSVMRLSLAFGRRVAFNQANKFRNVIVFCITTSFSFSFVLVVLLAVVALAPAQGRRGSNKEEEVLLVPSLVVLVRGSSRRSAVIVDVSPLLSLWMLLVVANNSWFCHAVGKNYYISVLIS